MPEELNREQIAGTRAYLLRRALFDSGMDVDDAEKAVEQHASRVTFDRTGVDLGALDALVEEIRESTTAKQVGYDPVKHGQALAGQNKTDPNSLAFR